MTKQIVYIARKDPDDELGETYIVIKVDCDSGNLTGDLGEIDHLIRREILSYITESPTILSNVVANVKTSMGTKYDVTFIPDRDVISQINAFIEEGNLVRTDLGNLVVGERYFEEYVGVFENSCGVLRLSEVSNVSFTRAGTILTITLDSHGLKVGDLVAIENTSVVGFTLTDFDVKPGTVLNALTLTVTNTGLTSGSNLLLRRPSGDVMAAIKYKYNTGNNTYVILGNVSPFTLNLGLVSKNDFEPPLSGKYVVSVLVPPQGSKLRTDQNIAVPNGTYFLKVYGGSLKTGIYNVTGGIGTLDDDTTSHFLRNDKRVDGGLEYSKATPQISQSVSSPDPTTLEVTFALDHGIIGEEYMFTSIDRYSRLRVERFSDKVVKIHLGSMLETAPTSVTLFRTVSKQVSQTIERYIMENKVLFKTLREIRNPNWDPSQKIDLPGVLGEDAVETPIAEPPSPTIPDNFKKYLQNVLNYPRQEYQLVDLQCEVFGSVDRALDGLRLLVDTSKVAREGVYREYHPNGHLKMRSQYRRFRSLGVLDGLYEEFFENGEPRVSYIVVPYHPYETTVPLTVIGSRILIDLANHNVIVGDKIVLNNSEYVVEDCPNPDQMYISPQSLVKSDGGYDKLDFIEEKGYFKDDLVRLLEFDRNGSVLTVTFGQHGLKAGDLVTITNPLEVGFGQTGPGIVSTPSPDTFTISVENRGNSQGKNMKISIPSVIRRADTIVGSLVTGSTVISRDIGLATFGNSVIHGSYIEYHKTLAFRVRCTFDRGVLQGELVQWDEEGNREYVAEFDRGNLKNREVLNYTFTY